MNTNRQNTTYHATSNQDNRSKSELVDQIKTWGKDLGFADVGITDTNLSAYEAHYFNWIGENFHGNMDYMTRHGHKRTRPNELQPGTQSIISVRLNYFSDTQGHTLPTLHNPQKAYVSRYALGRDYHKIMRKRLAALAHKIDMAMPGFNYRAFSDSAPVLEGPIATKAGLGFCGKNSLTIHPKAGSWFFLGEIYTSLKLPIDLPFEKQGCGACTACIQECPTNAIVADSVVDANRCISYLTIEFKGSIPLELRPKMGNRIYGCDDCQLVCPWNHFTVPTKETSFAPRHDIEATNLLDLWQWSENFFLEAFAGSPIRRIGYAQWCRNLAVAIGNMHGNSSTLQAAIKALKQKPPLNDLVSEHIAWAIHQLQTRIKQKASEPSQLLAPSANLKPSPFVAKKYYLPKQSST